jgi:hypothetical protein
MKRGDAFERKVLGWVQNAVRSKRASGPYLYWLWECKDYTRPIQVNESLGAQVPKGLSH